MIPQIVAVAAALTAVAGFTAWMEETTARLELEVALMQLQKTADEVELLTLALGDK